MNPCVLLVGTADTKAAELAFIRQCIHDAGGSTCLMDVGVLGQPGMAVDVSAHEVAAAAGRTLDEVRASGDENEAMSCMARGAVTLASALHAAGRVHGVLALGGTMGTDLALDVTAALPLGFPKLIVSTVAHSHLIPPERLAPDLMTMLWVGGLYGLNTICRRALAQAAGAIVGASRVPAPTELARPAVGITSFGTSALTYIVRLTPALEARGYEVVVFHCTGMGGRAFEALARERRFVAVLDLCLAEVANEANGSIVTAGAGRLLGAGSTGVPQIVAPGGADQVDMQAWRPLPPQHADRVHHAHNRLLASVLMNEEERRCAARAVASRLAQARGATAFIAPLAGIEAWDRPGQPLHDAHGLAAFYDELDQQLAAHSPSSGASFEHHRLDAHINDMAFTDHVLAIFDRWVLAGIVPAGEQPVTPRGPA